MTNWFVLIPFSFVMAYAIFGGVGFGLGLAGFLPETKGSKVRQRYFSPLWESALALLVGAVATVAALYPMALPAALVQNVTVLMTGDSNLLDHLGAASALGLTAMVLAIALWGGFYYRPGKPIREVARTSFWFGLVTAAVTLPLALSLDPEI